MTVMTEPHLPQHQGPRPSRWWLVFVAGVLGFGAVVFTFWLWWPLGVALGLIAGTSTVLTLGLVMHTSSRPDDSQTTLSTLEQLTVL